MNTDRRTFLGGMIAAAVQPVGTNGQGCPFSGWRATGEMPVAPGPSAEEFPVLLLELCGKWPGVEGSDVVTHLTSRRMVSVDLEDEDDWGDVNMFWDGEEMAWGVGNDIDGYWKIERVFEMIDPTCELHEDKFPVAYELTFDQFSKLMEERVESWACR